ncbi:uncharacterized protein LOC126897095 isoform X2 [Daktulosphaira vitifoliae]|uniref:uncharacterized protein LOC126897095 isoform X2 n=1 Tax=Daktulosphaira vitifoliae TaxID=58002 RepID=UPI0021AA6AC1|nr:uncharacterized protein LOC126897095 isoform X2 [Daktulosphaira vitifoliae]
MINVRKFKIKVIEMRTVMVCLFFINTVSSLPINQKDSNDSLSEENKIIEVAPGDTAILQCPSNDDEHRFQFWWFKPNIMIGPGHDIGHSKFRYEVLTGTLFIKEVTSEEIGVYTCICKHLEGETLFVKSVQLAIKKDWEDVWEHDYTVNMVRVVAVISVLVLITLLMYLYYLTTYKTSNRTLHFRDDSDEDISKDKQMYRKTNVTKDNIFHHGIDNPTLENDVDLDKIKNETKT